MNHPFVGLDGKPLMPGDFVTVYTDYPGSEAAHYHKMRGVVRMQMVDAFTTPCLSVRLDGMNHEVLLYPYELSHEEGLDE